MQVRIAVHTDQSNLAKENFEIEERSLDEEGKRFFKLFQESTFEGSQAATQKMKKYAKRQTKHNQNFLLFHSLRFLACSDPKMLSWPNSPLLVILQFVDPNVLFGNEETSRAPLHAVSYLANHSDYSTHESQLILAKQLIEHGASVNAVTSPNAKTPLHSACDADIVTNLDLVELLLIEGADPNAQDDLGRTPLVSTIPFAPGAAKFLLNWPTTDVNIFTRSGASFLAWVRRTVKAFSDDLALSPNPRVQHQFLLQQWTEIEEMLVEREAADTDITSPE
jgi:hypothetical protein